MEKKINADMHKELERLQKENELLKKLINSPPPTKLSRESGEQQDPFDLHEPVPSESVLKKKPYLMWSKDAKGHYTSVNLEFARSFDRSPDNFKGLTDFDFLPGKFAKKFHSQDLKIIQTGEPEVFEELLPLGDGLTWHEIVKIPLSENGRATGITAFSKNISLRKQNEKILKESEEKFRELAESITDSFILQSPERILYVNPAFESVYGYSRKELFKHPDLYLDCIHPEDHERIRKILQSDTYSHDFSFNEQYRIIKKDGTINWIWNRIFTVRNNKGHAYRMVSVAANISEIKDLEKSLRKSQEQQQAILDNIPHLAWLKGTDGRYVSVNKSFSDYYGLPQEDIRGKSDHELCPAKTASDFIRKDRLVISTKQARQFNEVEEVNGVRRYLETFKSPVMNQDGKVIGVAGISRDVTDQKLSEQALIKSEEKYKDLVTLLPEVVFETDKKGKITFANLKGFELTGYSQSDLLNGKTIFDLIFYEDLDSIKQIFKSFRFGSELKGKEFRIVTKSRKVLPVLVFTNNMYHENEWCGIRGVMVDISRRKEAERQEKLYQSKLLYLSDTALDFLGMDQGINLFRYIGSRLKEIVEGVDVIINRYDEQEQLMIPEYHSLSEENEALMYNYLKVSPPEFTLQVPNDQIQHFHNHSEHLFEFKSGFYEATFGKIPQDVSGILKKKLGVKNFFGIAFMRSGKLFGNAFILSYNEKLRDRHFIETFIYQASIALHRRQLEYELLEAKTMAEESDKLKTSFLANMSHEIRTPMNGILGLTEMLATNKVKGEKYKEYLAMINANGKLLMNLVNDIIDLSKIEARQVDLLENEFSLKELIEDVHCIIAAERMAKGKENIELKSETNLEGKPEYVLADQSKIKQVLINLIGNAVKFTQEGSVIFGVEIKANNELLFYVKDTGVGIPDNKKKLIFNRFTQVDESLSRSYSGSGLGLAISKGFIDVMGGEIWVESKLGEGSAFYFTLPLKTVTKKKPLKKEKNKGMADFKWKNLTILVVEDNLVSYKLLEISLSKTGCKTLHAENGADALELVEKYPEIDIVLMDIQLPVMNGYDATREIKKIRPDLPVIAQTANAMDSDRNKCLEAGCSDYVTKPIVLKNLLPLIENFVKEEKSK